MSSTCPDISDFERFVAGELGDGALAIMERHLATCPDCRDRVAEVRDNLQVVAPVRDALGRMGVRRSPIHDATPEFIGAYRIIREIGRGGMGIVYEAEQPNPRRKVAIKALHAAHGMDGRIKKMFLREAHALARLKHTSIASIHEAGQTEDGRLFFAMELIDGAPLTEFAARAGLSWRARLELFQGVCEAITYAHQRGVIHRDLKPSNILVDAAGRPKVLDFGLAKILEPDESTPVVTSPNEEGRIQGTLPYMSPEQVRGDLADVDVRSDVYSLGVILYELLSGRLPYRIDRMRLTESARAICEDAPARLSDVDKALRGDGETIVFKALEKDPDRRYSSASALAEDIAHFLAGRPIQARPPTLIYQVRKLVARHKAPASLVAAILVLIVGFAISMSVLYARATANLHRALEAETLADAEARRARQETDVATQIKDFLVDIFRVSDPGVAQGRTVTARELLDAAAQRVRRDLARKPELQATVMHTIGDVYGNLGLYQPAAELLQEALARQQSVDPGSMNAAKTASSLGTTLRRQGDLDGAQHAYQTALAIMKQRGVNDDVHVMVLMKALAEVLSARGDNASAEAAFRELLDAMRRSPHGRSGLPGCLNALAGVLADGDRPAEAVPLMREALQLTKEMPSGDWTAEMALRGNLAWLLAMSGQNDEAETMIRAELAERRRILPASHPLIATSLTTQGVIHMNRKNARAAEPLFREALAIREKALSPNHPDVTESRAFLGECLTQLREFDESERLLLASHESLQSDPNAQPRERAKAAGRLARLYEASGDQAKAETWRRATSAPTH